MKSIESMSSRQHTRKKTLGMFVLALLVGVVTAWAGDASPTNCLEFQLPLKEIAVSKTDNELAVFSGSALTGRTGQPGLPEFRVKMLLPPNAELRTVRAAVTNQDWREIEGKFDVAPIPPAISRGKEIWPKGVALQDGRDTVAYSTDAYSPPSCIALVLPSQMREWRMVEVEILPFKYNPFAQRLKQLAAGTLVVTFDRSPNLKPMKTRSPVMATKFRQNVQSQVVNFAEMEHEYEAAGK